VHVSGEVKKGGGSSIASSSESARRSLDEDGRGGMTMRHGGGSCGEAVVVRRLSVVLGGIESTPVRRACATGRCATGCRLAMTTDRGRGAAAPCMVIEF
jgi:hypothetical protein